MKRSRRFLPLSAAVAAVLAGLVGVMAVSPGSASAVRPVKGALYAEGGPDALAGAYL